MTNVSRTYATHVTGRIVVRLNAYRDTRGTQIEVVREAWNAARTRCARSVFMTSDRAQAFAQFRQSAQ